MISLLKQVIRYFFVGGTAALTVWVTFFLCSRAGIFYAISTCIAFLIATFVNFFLGRKFAFAKKSTGTKQEAIAVYLVSFVGLLINLGLMYLFVSLFSWNELFSKLIATSIAFFWNFFSRKWFIYKD